MVNRLNIPIKELKAKMWQNLGTHIPVVIIHILVITIKIWIRIQLSS